jgi:hypothetical protein
MKEEWTGGNVQKSGGMQGGSAKKVAKKVGERVGLQNKFHKFAAGFHADGLVRGRMEGNQS